MPESEAVRQMFAGIAGRYDCANHLLSGGLDYFWRQALVDRVRKVRPAVVIDLATGSGDVAFALARSLPREVEIIGMDFCAPMLEIAEEKKRRRSKHENLHFSHGDCLDIPLPDKSADAATIAFGLRNFEDRGKGLREILRVLRPGGTLFVLEFSRPDAWLRPFYYFYLRCVLPHVAGLATGRPDAYRYLAGSIGEFPSRDALVGEFRASGFSSVAARKLSGSIVAIHEASR
jgi:demethylmenaquinone methyltransferase/2-methoxy-6-polyprenyl-1,4-benzoquinol methylase